MPAIMDPKKEARRVAAVRAALQRDRRWERGAAGGNISPEGLRSRSQNNRQHGAASLALVWACRYADSLLRVLLVEGN